MEDISKALLVKQLNLVLHGSCNSVDCRLKDVSKKQTVPISTLYKITHLSTNPKWQNSTLTLLYLVIYPPYSRVVLYALTIDLYF